jgi:FAD synthetase
MILESLVSKYVNSCERALRELEISETCTNIGKTEVAQVVESAKAYLQDAKYYRDKKEFEVSLTSVSYCEGLLDALKMLGIIKIRSWEPTRRLGR